jgi:hypothetical protein
VLLHAEQTTWQGVFDLLFRFSLQHDNHDILFHNHESMHGQEWDSALFLRPKSKMKRRYLAAE